MSLTSPELAGGFFTASATDHELLIAKFRLKSKKVWKTTGPFRYDLNQILYDYTVEMKNRLKGFDLIECLKNYQWTFIACAGASDQNHPKEKCKKAKWLSEKALQIAEKKVKGKRERGRDSHLNAEFQRIARRDKKAFFSKEIEENNRMGKTKELLKKIRDTKETFYAKMGSIKDKNGIDLTEAEDIKKRLQEYTEELYKKDLHDQDNHDGMLTHLEPDILECELKWA